MTWHLAQMLLVAFGFCWTIGASKLTLPARLWLEHADARGFSPAGWLLSLVECRGCLGWWAGLAYGIRVNAAHPVLAGFTVLTSNLLLEAIVSNIKE